MLFMYIYLFLFFQSTLFLKKEDKKKKSIKNITKVVEICDKTVLEPFGIFQKKGSLPRRELLYPSSGGGETGGGHNFLCIYVF